QDVHVSVAADRFAQSRLRKVIPAVFNCARPSMNRSLEQCGHVTRLPATVKGSPVGASPIACTPRLTAVKKFPKRSSGLSGLPNVKPAANESNSSARRERAILRSLLGATIVIRVA